MLDTKLRYSRPSCLPAVIYPTRCVRGQIGSNHGRHQRRACLICRSLGNSAATIASRFVSFSQPVSIWLRLRANLVENKAHHFRFQGLRSSLKSVVSSSKLSMMHANTHRCVISRSTCVLSISLSPRTSERIFSMTYLGRISHPLLQIIASRSFLEDPDLLLEAHFRKVRV